MNEVFSISFDGDVELHVDDIWPDGDAPEHPTAQDVIDVMKKSGSRIKMMEEWLLTPFVEISVYASDRDKAEWRYE